MKIFYSHICTEDATLLTTTLEQGDFGFIFLISVYCCIVLPLKSGFIDIFLGKVVLLSGRSRATSSKNVSSKTVVLAESSSVFIKTNYIKMTVSRLGREG